MRREAKMILLLSDARGVNIPRDFAREIKRECVSGVSQEDWDILESGPDHESYWDVWQTVCDNAIITDPSGGTVYTVYQDDDCWLVERGAVWNGDGADEPDESIDCMFYVDDGEVQS